MRFSDNTTIINREFENELNYLSNLEDITRGNSIQHTDFEFKLRRIINEYLLSPKNAYSLGKGLKYIYEFREQLPHTVRIQNFHELSKVIEIGFILDCAQMSATASLVRTESRWGSIHRRTDYPDTDDTNWLKHIDLKIGSIYPDIEVSLRKVQRGDANEL